MNAKDKNLFRLRVLADLDSEYNVWVARCLETGSMVTADDPETVIEMMKEVLEDEITFAWENDNLANLYSTPAPREILLRWREAVEAGAEVHPLQLDLKFKEPLDGDLANVEVATAA
ncbi:MAG TPA: hypothetical protein VGQ41_06575 [Pyrinomonadaceae bacterium]|nr:hypothetical protein [Pyrinomonadaceae bacterium]